MAQKSEVYLELSASLERVLADVARRKASLIEDIARQQADFNTNQARVNDKLKEWETITKDATAKLEAIRNGPNEGSDLDRLRNEAESSIRRLSSVT